jgi:hypothetical protein
MRAISSPLLLALVASACTTDIGSDTDEPKDPNPITVSTDGVTAIGVDYSFARPSPTTLRADGYSFVVRYLSHDSSKNLSAGEADALIGAGLSIVSNWEAGATSVLGGYSQGVADAQAADAQATADGAPAGRPIYFSIDFDASAAQQGTINAYFDGVASVIGQSRTGAYGGYNQIKRLFDAGKITWGWQTYAWSGGQWDSRAQLRQVQNEVDGGCCDLDQAASIDYGQWGGNTPPTNTLEYAFQANTTDLWTVGTAGNRDWQLGMMPGTNPAICALAGGGFEVAFQANTGSLWTVGDAGNGDWQLGMMHGSSPSIACLSGGGYEVAFEANTTDLWTVGSAGNGDWHLGMMSGSSPSITALPDNGYEVAFEANTTSLWTVGSAGNGDWQLGMMSGTSPAITALSGGGYEVAFEANTTSLWTVGNAGNTDWGLGMMSGTSPAIVGLTGGGFEAAFEANTTDLWTVGNAGNTDWALGMMNGTNPAISALPNNGFEATFQANTTSLWQAGNNGTGPLNLGMGAGTSPAGT